MSQTRQLASNTAFQMIGRAIGTIFGVMTIAVMTRALGAEGYGHFTLAFTFLAIAGALADFGFTLTTTQMISETGADEPRIVSNAFTVRLVSGFVFFGLAAFVAFFMPYVPVVKATIAVGAFSFFFMALSQMFVGVFQKHLCMWRPAMTEAVSHGTIFLLFAVLATTQATVPQMMGVFAIGNALMA
ncbi:oligosaccharide flippase family protein, partial [Candidatus Uhrbacteria bacterium]|nr:oligosaccharide flippase family protein [Candidatus Uhrbacteria bacterium]